MKQNKKVINCVKNFKFEIEYALPTPTKRQQEAFAENLAKRILDWHENTETNEQQMKH